MKGELRHRWHQQFLRLEADGVDFVSTIPIDYDNPANNQVAASFTRTDFVNLDDCSYPRLPHVFWKMVFGQKCYLIDKK